MNFTKVVLCACLIFSSCLAGTLSFAQDSSLSLREAVERVLAEHPQFRIYQLRSDALVGEQEDAALQPPIELKLRTSPELAI